MNSTAKTHSVIASFKNASALPGVLLGLVPSALGIVYGSYNPGVFQNTAVAAQPLIGGLFLGASMAAFPLLAATLVGIHPSEKQKESDPAALTRPWLKTVGIALGVQTAVAAGAFVYANTELNMRAPEAPESAGQVQVMTDAPSAASMLAQKGIHLSL